MHKTSEELRQAALDDLRLDPFSETAFDDLTQLAAHTFGVPISAISIVDGDRQWFKSKVGMDGDSTSRAVAFCDHTIRTPDVLVVEDTFDDERFATNPLVTGPPGLRFYAAAPLVLSSGHAIGALCVMDTRPHQVDQKKLGLLRFMADQVVTTLESRSKTRDR